MLDAYVDGSANRLSPEAPVPVLDVNGFTYSPWWAANVAGNTAAMLANNVTLVWMLGSTNGVLEKLEKKDFDTPHDINNAMAEVNSKVSNIILKALCHVHNVSLEAIESPHMNTITKTRVMAKNHYYLRIDQERTLSEQETSFLTENNKEQIIALLQKQQPGYIIISDYNKWFLDHDLVDHIKKTVNNYWWKIFVDTKPSHTEWYHWVYLIKPNFSEFKKMMKIGEIDPSDDKLIEQKAQEFSKRYNCIVVVTRSEYGASYATPDGTTWSMPTQAQKVIEVSGAWDTFLAWLVTSLHDWHPLEEAIQYGNKASWIVVSHPWTGIITRDQLY